MLWIGRQGRAKRRRQWQDRTRKRRGQARGGGIGWGEGMGQGGVKRGMKRKPVYNYNVVDLFK